jgi:hypothetical protein
LVPEGIIRPAFPAWPTYNARLTEVVGSMTEEQLAVQPSPDRWPLWASIGHLACQRVFWLCVFAGAPGAETTPFTDAGNVCPGDEDLEHVMSAADLVQALGSTFRIVERCLDGWTLEMLAEEVSRPEWGDDDRRHPRGWALERVFAHDVYHAAELNEALTLARLPQVDLWG